MRLKALLFGSIGTLVETSELQRRSFNEAFEEAGLGWHWTADEYAALLRASGGQNRIRDYAAAHGAAVPVDAVAIAALHRRKTEHFVAQIASGPVSLRPGVARVLADARAAGLRVAWVTTTEPDTVAACLDRFREAWGDSPFDAVFDRSHVERSKPDPEVYRVCLETLGLHAAEALAIEDSPESVRAAVDAGIRCLATPGAFHAGADFDSACAVVDGLGDPEAPAVTLRAGVDFGAQVTLEGLDPLIEAPAA